jgi:transcriptional regulator with PAS, ATPase and Fis domain
MTSLIRKRLFLFVIVVVVLAVPALGGLSYHWISTSVPDPTAVKVLAERVLFVSIILTLVVVAVSIVAVLSTRNLNLVLDRLIEMNRLSGATPDAALARLGDVGVKIASIYAGVSELSTKKSRKISALSALNDMLLSIADASILIVDAAGRVVRVSETLAKQLGVAAPQLAGRFLDDLYPGADVESAIREATTSRAPVVRETDGKSLHYRPVVNRDGEVAYLLALLGRNVTHEIQKSLTAVTSSREESGNQSSRRSFFRRSRRARS